MPQMIQRSFTSGEIAPALRSRADTVKYATGLALCKNFFVRAQGGVYSRPGTRFIGGLINNDRKGRLIPFSFNNDQTYILVFEHLVMRVIKLDGFVLDGLTIFELATPYTEDELPRLGYSQNADVMTLVHHNHDPANLNRLADDNWTLTTINYASQITPPVFTGSDVYTISNITQANPAVVTITPGSPDINTGLTGVITGVVGMVDVNNQSFRLTKVDDSTYQLDDTDTSASAAYVSGGSLTIARSANTVGSGAGDYDKTYQYVVSAVVDGIESLPSAVASITTASLTTTAGVRLEWAAVTGAEYYRVYKDPSVNTGVFGWIGDSTTITFDDYNIAPITSDAPPSNRQPFTGANNKPAVVTYYQQRQVFANTLAEPQAVYTTQTGVFDSLRTSNPARADDAVTFTLVARQVNEIRHMLSLGSLVILTSGSEWVVTEGQDQVLTPATVGTRQQGENGSSWVPPVIVNSTALYLQQKGARVRDLGYDFSSDKYTGNDLSLMSEHFFEGHTIVDMAYAAEPYSILWCIRDDGVLLGLTYQREHQVYGWHQHDTDGFFESVATISQGDRDAVFFIVRREVNGQTVRYVERMESRLILSSVDAFCVDSGLTYSGPPATVFTGLDHLEGKTVSIVADGYTVNPKVVTGGQVEIQRAASVVHVGLSYTPVIETLDIDVASAAETLKGQTKSVNKVIIEVDGTRGGWVGPLLQFDTVGQMREIKPRFDSDGYDAIQLKTYKQEIYTEPTWGEGGGIRIEQRDPLPIAILSIIPRFDTGG